MARYISLYTFAAKARPVMFVSCVYWNYIRLVVNII